jgi:hypothetical protein
MTDGGTARLVRCRRIDVGNLPELPAAAALLCGCRSWLPAAAALGSSSVATSSATYGLLLAVLLPQPWCLSGVTLARGVGLHWRHFLLGRRSHRADLHNPIDLCQGALPLGHVFVEASTTRGRVVSSGATLTLPQLRARKVVFIPLLISQPDWDKYHFFGSIPYLILRVTGFDFASGPIPVNGQQYTALGGTRVRVYMPGDNDTALHSTRVSAACQSDNPGRRQGILDGPKRRRQ